MHVTEKVREESGKALERMLELAKLTVFAVKEEIWISIRMSS